MVAKISSGSSLYSALAYNHQKIIAGNAKVHFTNNMVEPKDGNFSIGSVQILLNLTFWLKTCYSYLVKSRSKGQTKQ